MTPITYAIIAICGSIALFSSVHDQNKASAEKEKVAQVGKMEATKEKVDQRVEISSDRRGSQ